MNKYVKLLLVVLLLVMSVVIVGAQESNDDTQIPILISITGAVSFDDDDLKIGDVIVAPAGAFRPSQLEEGQIVTVTGYMLNDDTLRALELETDVDNDDDDNDDNDDDDDDDNDDGEDGERNCQNENHPIVASLSVEFEVDASVVAQWHCDGNGFGEIARALMIEEAGGDSAEDLLQMRADGMGWGLIMQDQDIHPRDLVRDNSIGRGKSDQAPGRNKGDDDSGEDSTTDESTGNGRDTAPGQNRDNNGNANNGNGNNGNNGNGNNGNGNGNGKKNG